MPLPGPKCVHHDPEDGVGMFELILTVRRDWYQYTLYDSPVCLPISPKLVPKTLYKVIPFRDYRIFVERGAVLRSGKALVELLPSRPDEYKLFRHRRRTGSLRATSPKPTRPAKQSSRLNSSSILQVSFPLPLLLLLHAPTPNEKSDATSDPTSCLVGVVQVQVEKLTCSLEKFPKCDGCRSVV